MSDIREKIMAIEPTTEQFIPHNNVRAYRDGHVEARRQAADIAEAEVQRLEVMVKELEEGIIAVYDLINASEGVYGLHLNGDLSPWNELRKGGYFESWLSSFDEAIESLRDGKRVIGGE